jgi:flagellar motor switch protein FliN/FliY
MAAKKKTAPPTTSPASHPAPPKAQAPALDQLQEVEVELSVELGRHTLTLDQALHLGEHSQIELDKMVGEPVEVKLNGRPFARGEVVTVSENFAVRLTEILVRQGG